MKASLAVSLVLHVAVFVMLLSMSPISLPRKAASEYKLAIEGKEPKLVWYKFRRELPKVTPLQAKADRPLKVDTIAKQQIVASPPKALPKKQIVWTPAPEIAPQPVEDLPNLLALSVKLPPKKFVAPAPPTPKQIDLPTDAPVASQPKRFQQTLAVPKKLRDIEMPSEAAPQATASISRSFMAPVAPPAPTREIADLDTPPSIAIVGLKPVDIPVTTLPSPSPAQFAAAPELRKTGSIAAPGTTSGLTVPDLSVGNKNDVKMSLRAEVFAAPTSDRNMREAMRIARGGVPAVSREDPLPAAPRATAMKVSSAPDPRFNGRDTYVMAIQMPNLTSYSGSWLMWYADRTAKQTGLSPVAAPTPHRKVDPKYVASAAADKVEGKVQLYCTIGTDGNVSNVELVRGLDDRLNATAIEALAKWQFYPAVRDGQPVDVDVLVEIPFRLGPGKQAPF